MTDYLISEFINSIDAVISLPIQQTQRIKYTAFDVSEEYIVFGANSGGLYIFNRHPCSFIKLIPSTEGCITCLAISNDEKIIAAATTKGTLCLFDNEETSTRSIQVFNEHQGNKITALKWHHSNNELYCGDNTGKISVIVSNFITKTVFQTPCTMLMQLDSCIVQLDCGSRFLLVSTLSRCYLCDTEAEHYRQIGKKLRDGEYGACFFGTKLTYTVPCERKIEIGSFSILNDKEFFTTYDGLENLKIFCARPGARIWEVQLNGTVVRTHQFKEALNNESNHIIALENTSDCRLNFQSNPKTTPVENACNFMNMYILDNNFILTYNANGLYILDPQNVAIVFWTDFYTDITEVKIIKKFIYIRTSKNKIHILLFSTLENFIIKTLLNKMYMLCADLCILYQTQIKKILPSSHKLHLLTSLNDKLLEIEALELHEQIQPILNSIKELTSNRQTAQKLSSGIFIVDNAHFINSLAEDNTNDAVCLTIEKTTENVDCCIENIATYLLEDNSKEVISSKRNKLLYEEYELNKINFHFKTTIVESVCSECMTIKEITDIFSEFVDYFQQNYSENVDINIWCYDTCLNYLESNQNKFDLIDISTSHYLKKAFEIVNSNTENTCKCSFPLPKASTIKPKFYNIGKLILEYCWKENCHVEMCSQVPYMWKEVMMLQEKDVLNLLPLIIQYGNMAILNYFSNKFTYDSWSEILNKYILLKSGKCLNCEQEFIPNDQLGLSWNDLATEMISSIGAESTVYLLSENADCIPSGELNFNFYQSCIFSTMVDKFDTKLRNTALNFVKDGNLIDENFGKLLEKTLQNDEFININVSSKLAASKCCYCSMPLQIPVLSKEKLVELKCGHFYHNICFNRYNKVCNICKN